MKTGLVEVDPEGLPVNLIFPSSVRPSWCSIDLKPIEAESDEYQINEALTGIDHIQKIGGITQVSFWTGRLHPDQYTSEPFPSRGGPLFLMWEGYVV